MRVFSAPMPDATAAIILIGDVILSGKVRDENALLLIGELRELGVALRRLVVVPDDVDDIAGAVGAASARFDHVFTSGGVGPTHDDRTMAGVAQAFGLPLVRHPELEAQLRAFYGAACEERHLRMAEVPAGVALLTTDQVLWPAVSLRNVYILPGIPALFRRKFMALKERFRQAPFHLRAVVTRADEGHIAGRLDRVAADFPEVAIGSYPRHVDGRWLVRVTLEGKERARVDQATSELVAALGDVEHVE